MFPFALELSVKILKDYNDQECQNKDPYQRETETYMMKTHFLLETTIKLYSLRI